ncbi:hypothetical protein CANCADRAFT_875 [Tortispora caseinolytica NRRL Y-17796]|uniref:Uncharacterized protein n=1 Tax=Tortispora caseinolytica NRRL Y-17796 TaxID=767744 RepID=A0A1E4TKK4_9ASCO|nr:hypothetical protein CANCADRAFT_875 [Tortispora caseinolytica NRRL Y-17796]
MGHGILLHEFLDILAPDADTLYIHALPRGPGRSSNRSRSNSSPASVVRPHAVALSFCQSLKHVTAATLDQLHVLQLTRMARPVNGLDAAGRQAGPAIRWYASDAVLHPVTDTQSVKTECTAAQEKENCDTGWWDLDDWSYTDWCAAYDASHPSLTPQALRTQAAESTCVSPSNKRNQPRTQSWKRGGKQARRPARSRSRSLAAISEETEPIVPR